MERIFYINTTPEGAPIKGSLENWPAIRNSLLILIGHIVLLVGASIYFSIKKTFCRNPVMKIIALFSFLLMSIGSTTEHQDVNAIIQQVKAKIELVNDYEATGKMKTNVSFLKVPEADVKIYFKKPNKLKIKNEKGHFLCSERRRQHQPQQHPHWSLHRSGCRNRQDQRHHRPHHQIAAER